MDLLPVRLDHPFAWQTNGGVREVILRLWSARPTQGGHRASERVATRIGPALEEWFQAHESETTLSCGLEVVQKERRTPRGFMQEDG